MVGQQPSLDSLLSLLSGQPFELVFDGIGAAIKSHSLGDIHIVQGKVEVNYRIFDFGNPDYEVNLQRQHQAYLAALQERFGRAQEFLNREVKTELAAQRQIEFFPVKSLPGTLHFIRCYMNAMHFLRHRHTWNAEVDTAVKSATAAKDGFSRMSLMWKVVADLHVAMELPVEPAEEIRIVYDRLTTTYDGIAESAQRIRALFSAAEDDNSPNRPVMS